MPTRRNRRTWKDGDTYLMFAVIFVACGIAILRHAMIAENWIDLSEPMSIGAAW